MQHSAPRRAAPTIVGHGDATPEVPVTPTDAVPWLDVLGTLGVGLLVVLAGLLAAGALAARAIPA